MTKAAELRELNDVELANALRASKEELFNLRFQRATGELEDSSRLDVLKKDIARCRTLLREREIALAEGTESGSTA
jgi:large subunit ribosomal protein L29